jgi:hypothetical protein
MPRPIRPITPAVTRAPANLPANSPPVLGRHARAPGPSSVRAPLPYARPGPSSGTQSTSRSHGHPDQASGSGQPDPVVAGLVRYQPVRERVSMTGENQGALAAQAWLDSPNAQGQTPIDAAYADKDMTSLRCLLKFLPAPDKDSARRTLQLIRDKQPISLSLALRTLPPTVLDESRKEFILAALETGDRATIRAVTSDRHMQICEPFRGQTANETALHLGIWQTDIDRLRWAGEPGFNNALLQRNGDGRTPLLAAAARGDVIGLSALLRECPRAALAETDNLGRGILELTFMADEPAALALLKESPWVDHITQRDIEATAEAFANRLNRQNVST